MVIGFVFKLDIIVGPLLCFLFMDHVEWRAYIVVRGRNCVVYKDVKPPQLILLSLFDYDA